MHKSQVINSIGDHFPAFEKVVRNGFESHHRLYSETAEVHTKRTQANLRYDHMIREATKILPKRLFRLIRAGKRTLFSFRGELLIQFKMLNRKVTTSNYPTPQAERFDKTGEVDGLPGILKPIPLISIGYVARSGFGLEGIFITQIVNHRPSWVHRLDSANEQQTSITSILANDEPATQPSRVRRIHRRAAPDSGSTAS
jgi:hypothetical protein